MFLYSIIGSMTTMAVGGISNPHADRCIHRTRDCPNAVPMLKSFHGATRGGGQALNNINDTIGREAWELQVLSGRPGQTSDSDSLM